MSKRKKNAEDSFDTKIAKIIKFKEECLQLIKRYDEEGVLMDDAGERRMLQLQKWRREMVHAEEYLAKHIQYDDAEYSDGEVEQEHPEVVIYETGLEPLNTALTRFINVRVDGASYRSLHPKDVDVMVEDIKARGNCALYSNVVPKDPELYFLWRKNVIEHVKFRVRLEQLGLDCENLKAVYCNPDSPSTSDELPVDMKEDAERKTKARECFMQLANRLTEMAAKGELSEEEDDENGNAENLLDDDEQRSSPEGGGFSDDDGDDGHAKPTAEEVVLSSDEDEEPEAAVRASTNGTGGSGARMDDLGESPDQATVDDDDDPAVNDLEEASHELSHIIDPGSDDEGTIQLETDSEDEAGEGSDDDIMVIDSPGEVSEARREEDGAHCDDDDDEFPDASLLDDDDDEVQLIHGDLSRLPKTGIDAAVQ